MDSCENGRILEEESKPSIVSCDNDKFSVKLDYNEVLVDSENKQTVASDRHFTREHVVQYGIGIIVTLIAFVNGLQYGWIGPTLRKIMLNETNIQFENTRELAWISGSLKIGGVFGPFLGSFLSEYCGRKTTIYLACLPFFVIWIIIAVANNVYHLCFAEFICGISGQGAITVLPMYIGETASPKIRGTLAIFIPLQFYVAFMLENIIVPYISNILNSSIAALITLMFFCTCYWMPESPYYYLMKNQPKKAAKSLRKLTQTEYVEGKLERIKVAIEKQRETKLSIYQLLKDPLNRRAFWIIVGVGFIHQFSGFIVVLLYAQVIFEKAETSINPNLGGIMLCAVAIIVLFVSIFFVDNWGRRPLLIMSSIATAIPLTVMGLYFHLKSFNYEHIGSYNLIPIIALVLFKFTYGIGIGPLIYVTSSEMFSTNFKAVAMCSIYSFMSLVNFVILKGFNYVEDIYGAHYPFYFFAMCCLCGAMFGYFILPETKGKTLEEIQILLKKRSK